MPHPRYSPHLQRIQQWFYHRVRKSSAPSKSAATLLSATKPRKTVPLTRWQAYSILFCQKGSLLHEELQAEFDLYIAADEDTLNKYQRLFPSGYNLNLKFLAFQQVILRERISSITAEELSAVDDFISKNYEEQKSLAEHPWEGFRTDEFQTDADLERLYIERCAYPLFL